jgi:myo-inositol 2-dehydrogenase/D-chiro-inositol 1-dehydrogenase
MIEKNITIALIGAGRIGKMHAGNIIANFPNVNLKTVVDLELDKEWVKSIGIPNGSKDIKTITQDNEIDAVVITTPSNTHVDLIQLIAESGKHIFCEKPIAFNLQSIQKAIDSVNKAGVLFQVGFNRRFDPDYLKVKNAVDGGEIGNPHIVNITSRDPIRPNTKFIPGSGGLFMDFCTHDFDMIRFITNCDVEEIFVKGANLVDPIIGELGDIDTAIITLKLTNGIICCIDVCRETNYGYDQQLEVFGSKGSIRAQNLKPTSVILSNGDGVSSDSLLYSFVERYKVAYLNELKGFIECLENNTKPLVSGEDAYKAVKIAIAAEQSLKLNQTVRLD